VRRGAGPEPPGDILINNVGGRRVDVPTEDTPVAQWQELIDLNLTSALVCSQQCVRGMLERGRGAVINVTSVAGAVAIKGFAAGTTRPRRPRCRADEVAGGRLGAARGAGERDRAGRVPDRAEPPVVR
jgi:NAD(P)-dependent dehydrogenase (short-subunit alcohol dehydrogenase family)